MAAAAAADQSGTGEEWLHVRKVHNTFSLIKATLKKSIFRAYGEAL